MVAFRHQSFPVGVVLIGVLGMVWANLTVAFPFDSLDGYWGSTVPNIDQECHENPHKILFNTARDRVFFIPREPLQSQGEIRHKYWYHVLSVNEDFLRVRMNNERRLDANGQPVVWHLIPKQDGIYVWGRDDWEARQTTHAYERCRQGHR